MEEKTKKDRKIKDKKVKVIPSVCYYFAGICFLLTGILSIVMGENLTMVLMYLPIGSLYIFLAVDAQKKEKNRDDGSEDEKKPL